jgi:hypothetical protein
MARLAPVRGDHGLGRLRLAGHQEPGLKYWQKQGIDMQAFLTEAQGKVVNFPNSPGVGDALTDIDNDLGPAFLGTEPVSQALKTAQTDADYVLRTS